MTVKEQLLYEIKDLTDGFILNTVGIETLSGNKHYKRWIFPKSELIELIENNFDNNLKGYVNDGDNIEMTLLGWEFE